MQKREKVSLQVRSPHTRGGPPVLMPLAESLFTVQHTAARSAQDQLLLSHQMMEELSLPGGGAFLSRVVTLLP